MLRTLRACAANYCYHVLNRGISRERVFHGDGDYAAFVATLAEASLRIPMRLLAYCLMPTTSTSSSDRSATATSAPGCTG